MEIDKAKEQKDILQTSIANLLKEFEKNTSLSVCRISFVRQPQYDSLGGEVDFRYVVEAEICL